MLIADRRPLSLMIITLTLVLQLIAGMHRVSAAEFQLPGPTGTFAVGTRFFYWVDQTRPDVHTTDPDDFRALSLQVWYPAQPAADQTPKPFSSPEAAENAVKFGVFIPDYIDQVAPKPSHAFLNAPVDPAQDSLSVILFSTSGIMDGQTLLAEELASHGYLVFLIGHPHWCEYYYDADGRILFRDKENDVWNMKMWEEENSEIVRQTKEELTLAKTVEDKLILQRKLNRNMPLEISDIELWAEDIGYIIDELVKMNDSDPVFAGLFDLQRIGVMGYSKGGAAAGQACLSEGRVRAGINLSGFMFGEIAESPLKVPFMVIESVEPWCQDCPPINDLLFHASESSIYMVQIDEATHANFSDLSALKNYMTDNFKNILGPIDGYRFLSIMNGYALQFFNRHLKGMKAPLLGGQPSPYAEVKMKAHHPS